MADDIIQLAIDGAGKKVDNSSLTVGANTVYRQRTNAASPTDPAGIAEVRNAEPASSDYGLVVRQAPNGLSEAIINFNTSGDATIVAAVAAKVVRVWKFYLIVGGACTITVKDGATPLMGPITLNQGGEIGPFVKDADPWFTGTADNAFVINSDTPVQVSGRTSYTQV